MATKFGYSTVPLDSNFDQIRLISFDREHSTDTLLSCRLVTFPLAETPKYAAISYAWGDLQRKVPVSCNQGAGLVYVTQNLLGAFEFYWKHESSPFIEHEYQWLWADAICINQDDVEERGSQVSIMRQIYAGAGHTLIWLGELNHEAEQALNGLKWMLKAKRKYEEAGETRCYSEMDPEDRITYHLSVASLPEYTEPFLRFLQGGWFVRVWVIQELAVSRAPVLNCGPVQVSWEEVFDAVEFDVRVMLHHFDDLQHIRDMIAMRSAIQLSWKPPLLYFLVLARSFHATDPRDKVYALLGLSGDSDSLGIQPDYTMTVDALYKLVASNMLIRKDRLEVLNVPRASSETSCLQNFSWVPDWTQCARPQESLVEYSDPVLGPRFLDTRGRGTGFSATPICVADNYEFQGHDGNRSPPLIGMPLGTIASLGEEMKNLVVPDASWKQVMSISAQAQKIFCSYERICDIESDRPYEFTGESMREVYRQTLAVGLSLPQFGGDEGMKRSFENWYKANRSQFRFISTDPRFLYLREGIKWIGVGGMLSRYMLRMMLDSNARFPFPDARAFQMALSHCLGRRMFRTHQGHIGIGTADARSDDSVFLVKGCRTPLVLRRTKVEHEWELVGDCYVHGAMTGKLYKEELCKDLWLI